MLATKLFPETFRNFQKLLIRNEVIQKNILNQTTNPFTFHFVGNIYALSNMIQIQLSQLQQDHVINHLQSFYFNKKRISKEKNNKMANNQSKGKINLSSLQKIQNITKQSSFLEYDQTNNFFTIKYRYLFLKNSPLLQKIQDVKRIYSSGEINQSQKLKAQSQNQKSQNLKSQSQKSAQFKNLSNQQTQQLNLRHNKNMPLNDFKQSLQQRMSVNIKVYNCRDQRVDVPQVRQTLYFHELKDMDKLVRYDAPQKTPLFMQDLIHKRLQMTLLDKKNPYGVPKNAPPLYFEVQLQNKVYFKIKSTYDETIVEEIGSLKKIKNSQKLKKIKISGMKIPRLMHQVIYKDLMTQMLQISDQQILKIHKLAYIGGRIQKINLMMNVHQAIQITDQKQFDKWLMEI